MIWEMRKRWMMDVQPNESHITQYILTSIWSALVMSSLEIMSFWFPTFSWRAMSLVAFAGSRHVAIIRLSEPITLIAGWLSKRQNSSTKPKPSPMNKTKHISLYKIHFPQVWVGGTTVPSIKRTSVRTSNNNYVRIRALGRHLVQEETILQKKTKNKPFWNDLINWTRQ